MKSKYENILSAKRFRKSEITDRTLVDESTSDYSRILYSAPFRRMQQKAQVFSLEHDAAVRSRLTHSLEVAEVGRRISGLVSQELFTDEKMTVMDYFTFSHFTETACLMHDLGNPPFGHFGEIAIKNWFKTHGERCYNESVPMNNYTEKDWHVISNDLFEFDGNPQGIRIVMKLLSRSKDDIYGLNLTYTQLLSGLKYVRCTDEEKSGFTQKKPGYFLTEKIRINDIWQQLDYPANKRFPIAYIVEAADDIAYCLSDIDDGIYKGIIKESDFLCYIKNEAESCNILRCKTMLEFKTTFMGVLIKHAVNSYLKNEELLFDGNIDGLIDESSPEGVLLNKVKQYSRDTLYRSKEAEEIEISGYHVIYGLLETFSLLLLCDRNSFANLISRKSRNIAGRGLDVQWRLFNRLPINFIHAYENDLAALKIDGINQDSLEWLLRAHLIIDYVSSMTDHYSLQVYKKLTGISLD